ncbi:pep-cterm sorting domain-containing protein [Anaeramoeba flamelloides]|uniref:Pep-cterm sorting domain-containing protein n=1 Tax=Anaeramoeba flamelloides TaxID=1746091 RepID=A0AAV7ZF28_9EUKA|nr:pep-cterm sorting domain-containing protein [Anaeramoeba flamelloides]
MEEISIPVDQTFSSLFKSPILSDLKFKFGDKHAPIPAHQLVVSLFSDFFRELLYPLEENNRNTSETINLKLEGLEIGHFITVLKFCYTGKITLNFENIYQVCQLSWRFRIDKLLQECENFLQKNGLPSVLEINSFDDDLNQQQQQQQQQQKNQEQEKDQQQQEQQVSLNNVSQTEKRNEPRQSGISIALIVADQDTKYIKNVASVLSKSEVVQQIRVFRANKKKYPYSELRKYDVAFVYASDSKFVDPIELGNDLVRFVEDGGGLVLCSINCLDLEDEQQIYGKILEPQYLPFGKGTSISNQPAKLGEVCLPFHPIMNGVNTFDGGNYSFRIQTPKLSENSKTIAKWEDGNVLVAEKTFPNHTSFGKVIVLNLYPPNNSVDINCWKSNSDGEKLFLNSVLYAANNTLNN